VPRHNVQLGRLDVRLALSDSYRDIVALRTRSEIRRVLLFSRATAFEVQQPGAEANMAKLPH
jgi:hypothetical protein